MNGLSLLVHMHYLNQCCLIFNWTIWEQVSVKFESEETNVEENEFNWKCSQVALGLEKYAFNDLVGFNDLVAMYRQVLWVIDFFHYMAVVQSILLTWINLNPIMEK